MISLFIGKHILTRTPAKNVQILRTGTFSLLIALFVSAVFNNLQCFLTIFNEIFIALAPVTKFPENGKGTQSFQLES